MLAISWPQDYLFVTGRNPIGKTLIKIRNVVIDVVTHHKNCIQDPIFLATIGEPAAEENDRTDVELKHAYQGIARPLFAVSVEKTAENERVCIKQIVVLGLGDPIRIKEGGRFAA